MYRPPTKEEILALPPLPDTEDPGLNVMVGDWTQNRATDENGIEWYTVTNKARPFRVKVFKVKR